MRTRLHGSIQDHVFIAVLVSLNLCAAATRLRASEIGDEVRPPAIAVTTEKADRCTESRIYVRERGGMQAASATDLQAFDTDDATAAVLAGNGSQSLEVRFIGAPRWLNRIQAITDSPAYDIEIWDLERNWVAYEGERSRDGSMSELSGSDVKVRGIRFTPSGAESEVHLNRLSALFEHDDADDDATGQFMGTANTYHYDWANDYPGSSDDLSKCDNDAQGLADDLPSWSTPGHGDSNAHEVHFKRSDMGGSNGSHVDNGDLSYWAGHGSDALWDDYWDESLGGIILGNQTEDDDSAMPGDAHDAYGDGDMEWLVLAACQVLNATSRPYWHDTFVGNHLVCGAETNIDDASYGGKMGNELVDNGAFDTAKTVKSSWFDAMEAKNGSGRTAIVLAETSTMGNDYIWGEGSVASDPTHDCCYTAWGYDTGPFSREEQNGEVRFISTSGDALGNSPLGQSGGSGMAAPNQAPSDPVQFERTTERGFTVTLDRGLLSQPAVESMQIYNVIPASIDSNDVRQAASFLCSSRGILCGGDIGPGGPDEINLIDGVHELRVCRSTGSIHYEDVSRWLAWRTSPPELPSPNVAVGMANQILHNWGRMPEDAVVRDIDYLRQSFVTPSDGVEVENPDSSFATAIRVSYQRVLESGPSFPVVGPGASMTVALGNQGRLLRVFEGAWRDVQPGNQVPLITLAEVISALNQEGWDAAVTAIRTPISVLQIDTWEHAYYEADCEEDQQRIRPVYLLHCTLIHDTATGGATSEADISVWADRLQPRSEILTPPDGTHVPEGTEVCFTGTGSGGMPPLTLSWRDDLGNLLGTGPTLCTFLEAPPDTGDGSDDRVRTVTLIARDALGREGHEHVRIILDAPSDAPDLDVAEAGFELANGRPNPFSSQTEITFRSPGSLPATLRIFDPSGRVVRTLYDGPGTSGVQRVAWDGRDDSGEQVAAGVYFYELNSGREQTRKKLVLVR